ncbi:hypothetical protein J2T60_000126 [Natronospira proteinivora]|uniref:DUF3108 domain-containing protein n=1 Tax=Natronospira proteinivora TaxID=1807133 RepID=A0ABT1G4E2_9GAMM|nr:DUF3108 domain-containing protein [Natronospira proteinivora]MCP1726161.1 hypothetical protein [Natronospira proteinivora]
MTHRANWTWLITLVLAVITTPAVADQPEPQAFEAEYRAFYGSMRGAATRFQLESHENDQWLWRSISEPAGMVAMFRDDVITEESRFSIGDEGLVLHSYHYLHLEGDEPRRERLLDVDWDRGTVRYDDDGNQGEMDARPGSLDRFLAQYALMRDLARGERPEQYLIVDRDEHFEQRLRYRGEEGIRTRAGRFTTLRVDMEDKDSDRVLAVWMAPELGYLPVQLEQREPGERTVRMELEDTDHPGQ